MKQARVSWRLPPVGTVSFRSGCARRVGTALVLSPHVQSRGAFLQDGRRIGPFYPYFEKTPPQVRVCVGVIGEN
jgi:hypothetical protein